MGLIPGFFFFMVIIVIISCIFASIGKRQTRREMIQKFRELEKQDPTDPHKDQ